MCRRKSAALAEVVTELGWAAEEERSRKGAFVLNRTVLLRPGLLDGLSIHSKPRASICSCFTNASITRPIGSAVPPFPAMYPIKEKCPRSREGIFPSSFPSGQELRNRLPLPAFCLSGAILLCGLTLSLRGPAALQCFGDPLPTLRRQAMLAACLLRQRRFLRGSAALSYSRSWPSQKRPNLL